MKKQNDIYQMTDRELKSYRRVLKLRRERRRKMFVSAMTALATICVILVFAVSHNSLKSNANSGFKYYTSITVEAGETLWELADEFMDYDHYKNKSSYIAEVQSINHLSEDAVITAGQMLIVPYYSGEYVE